MAEAGSGGLKRVDGGGEEQDVGWFRVSPPRARGRRTVTERELESQDWTLSNVLQNNLRKITQLDIHTTICDSNGPDISDQVLCNQNLLYCSARAFSMPMRCRTSSNGVSPPRARQRRTSL